MWCKHCKRDRPTYTDESTCSVCCQECGRVVNQGFFSEEPSFIKGPGGESRASGSFVRSIQKDLTESLERSLNNGKYAIRKIAVDLDMNSGSLESQAGAFYKVAAERGFTRGRRTDQVAASCLYIACRVNKSAYLLIDFSENLGISVYVLGAVFLQLCELLRLTEHPFVQKPVDPSLFLAMFTERLLGVGNIKVTNTALSIIASMKRDWMQTGRKPSGLCGAAIYISALSHGFKYSKSDVVKVVHICDATLSKRLIEFENTDSGCLTMEEFNKKGQEFKKNANEYEKIILSGKYLDDGSKSSDAAEMLCVHKGSGEHPFAHGLCKSCYLEFIQLSGGLEGGSDPPAFQKAERERTAEVSAEKTNESEIMTIPDRGRINENHSTQSFTDFANTSQNIKTVKEGFADSETRTVIEDEIRVKKDAVNPEEDDSLNLSDIDDIEVDGYLNNKEEIHFKTIIWEEMNKEYLEEQAIKAAVTAAATADISNLPDDVRAAHELSAAAAAAVAKSRKERQQKRAAEAKNATPAQTAAEATRQMLTKKRLSSKINYDVLDKLFDGDDLISNTKKSKVESEDDDIDALKWGLREKELKAVSKDNDVELGLENDDSDYLDDERADEQESYYGNEHDAYDFDDDEY